MRLALILLAIAGLLASPVAAQDLPGLGTTARDTVGVGTRVVPLLKGDWTVAAVGETRSSTHSVPIGRVILVQLADGKLSRWIHVQTNLEWNSAGWKRSKEVCDRRNVHYAYADDRNSPKEAECWILNHHGMTLGSNASQVWIDFFRWSDSRGRPNTALTLEYYFLRNGELLEVAYYFNPVVDGFRDTTGASWRGNPWHVDVASKDARKLDYLRGLKATGEEQFARLRTVLK
jgi:hypothetical protein